MDPVPDNRVTLLRALRGAPLTVLAACFILRHAAGPSQLAAATGYSRRTVTTALHALAAAGLIQQHARYHGWLPTAVAHQLFLPAPDGQTLPLPPSSSGSPFPPSPDRSDTPPQPPDGNIFPLEPAWAAVAEDLTRYCSIPPTRAQQAVAAAQHRWDPDQTRYYAYLHHAYATDSKTINNPPFFTAARIEDGTPPPDTYRPPAAWPLASQAWRAQHRWRLRDETLDQEVP